MRQLSDADVVRAWELGRLASPARRAMTLLAVAGYGTNDEALGALTPGERDARLLAVRRRSFGDAMECVAPCPACGERLEFSLDAATIVPDGAGYAADTRPMTLVAAGYQATVQPPTLRDVEELAAAGERALLERCVLAAEREGRAVAPAELPQALVAAIDAHLASADPAAVIELAMRCPACEHAWAQLFDIVGFFWAEVAARAERLFGEVHTLARAYGWSEAAILALGPARRERYLELVGA
jgi:hypothetical protein